MNTRSLALLAMLVAACFGLATAAPTGCPGGCPKAVVLDFPVGPRDIYVRDDCRCLLDEQRPLETASDIRGWWFGSNDIYWNANVGKIAADAISEALRTNCAFEIYSRENLKYYLADKREALAAKFTSMKSDDLDKALMALDPVKVGQEVGVDYVVIGRVCTSEMRASRAWMYWNSTMAFSIVVIDVKTGAPVFQASYGGSKGRRSQLSALEEYGKLVAQDVNRLFRTGEHPKPRIQQREP